MSTLTLVRQENAFVAIDQQHARAVARVWELPVDAASLSLLKVDHVLPFLTSMEADLAMLRWHDALAKGGQIELTAPNADYFIQLWQQASWDNTNLIDAESVARRAFAGLWGTQSNGNPRDAHYDANVQQVYKSGYNPGRLTLLLERAGFCQIEVVANEGLLIAKALKTMNRTERQITTHYDQIRPDHLNRYEFACQQLASMGPQNQVLDLACGIGYGTLMLAKASGAQLTGVDIDAEAIAHAQAHFSNSQTRFICQDARLLTLADASQDAIISFETIEHIDFVQQLLNNFFRLLKPGGRLICSTPNQEVMPFDKDKFKFHLKHYSNDELLGMLEKAGFDEVTLFAQHDPVAGVVVAGGDGCFSIAVAIKAGN